MRIHRLEFARIAAGIKGIKTPELHCAPYTIKVFLYSGASRFVQIGDVEPLTGLSDEWATILGEP
jgi:hypothetical protein